MKISTIDVTAERPYQVVVGTGALDFLPQYLADVKRIAVIHPPVLREAAARIGDGCDAEVLLLEEPGSALDPISTAKIEELIAELKNDYTVVIVTHNMQQAARCSDYTAYMYLGDLVEFGATEQMFFKPQRKETEDYITGRFG